MSEPERLKQLWERCRENDHTAFVPFMTAGFPTKDVTVDVILALERGGADMIEVGFAFSDPMADGKTIQHSHQAAIDNGTTLHDVLRFVKEAREKGLQVPVILMGYLNPVLNFVDTEDEEETITQFIEKSKEAGVDGFIIVDLPLEEAGTFAEVCQKNELAYVTLVFPTTTPSRLKTVCEQSSSFVYAVSQLGVTGGDIDTSDEVRSVKLPDGSEQDISLPAFVSRVKAAVHLPVVVGFGIKTHDDFVEVSEFGDGCVIGSEVIRVLDKSFQDNKDGDVSQVCRDIEDYAKFITNK